MSRIVVCPCCDQVVKAPRTKPITDAEFERALALMMARGWTVQRLLTERYDDLEYIAPGLTSMLERRQASWPTQ